MSTMQRMTLIGIYEYFNTFDEDLFSNLNLPEGYSKETFVNSLLLEHGEKCVLYSNPDFMRQMIGTWSDKWNLELSRIYEALSAEYNPIWNYDRYEGSGDKRVVQSNAGHKATDSPDFTVSQTVDGTSEHKVSADNSGEYQPEAKDINNMGATNTKGKTQDLSETSNSKTDDQLTHNAHLYGNIGVTTSASMVSEILRQRFQYNLYDIACKLFASELLIGIY